eukprot:1155620-Pelagomonas_calceolata.AAC.12
MPSVQATQQGWPSLEVECAHMIVDGIFACEDVSKKGGSLMHRWRIHTACWLSFKCDIKAKADKWSNVTSKQKQIMGNT